MKSVLFSLCLIAATVSAPTTLTRGAQLEGNVAIETAILSTLNCIPSTDTLVLRSHQHEVHAVVVDMPQRASLEYASPDTWATLPTADPPDEESPTKPVLQVALN
jgi:hypothetical protein